MTNDLHAESIVAILFDYEYVFSRLEINSQGAKGLKWKFFDHESEQAEFGLKL